MGNIFIYIITGICLLAPYGYFGQDTVNGILFLLISMFSLLFVKRIKGNKVYLLAYILMVLVGVISLFNSSLTIETLQGLSLYFSGLMLYIAFTFYKEKEVDIIKISTYIIAISALYYVVIQGSILNGGVLKDRIDGNIGYANSYALIMLIGLYFNKIREENSIKEMLDIIFITGLLFTGSRNSLLYLGIFVIID
ncbi:MAG: polymerase, partial [Clostridiales bacterium]|nr:polymerase [Clostridiales bacterium]